MRPTFLGFEAAKTGVFASQKALDIVGHNLSNISTDGYTRQRVDQVSQHVNAEGSRYHVDLTSLAGMGVLVNGVEQLRDKRLDTAYRQETTNSGYYNQQSTMLSEIETIINELDIGDDGNGYGLSFAVKDMYTALEDFSYNASSVADANIFASSIKNVTDTLNRLSSNLTKASVQYKEELTIRVDEVNAMLKDIATLNGAIRQSMTSHRNSDRFGPNELKDQRNLLLDKLSEYGSLRVEEEIDGTVTVEMNGHKCVWDINHDGINYQENADGTVQLNWKNDGENAAKEYGIFKATLDILNGRGMGAVSKNESTTNGFLYYQDKLDAFATTLTDVLNHTFPEKVDANGNVLTYKKLVGERVDTPEGSDVKPDMFTTAERITVTDALLNDSSYLINADNSVDNTAILELIQKLTINDSSFFNGTETFTGTFQEFVADYTATLGSDNTYVEGRYKASEAVIKEIQDSRDSVSGVSESEETVNMMTYNRAFQAASRMMTVMDGLLDVIINKMAV